MHHDMAEKCGRCKHRYGYHSNGDKGPCVKCDCDHFYVAAPTPEDVASAIDNLKDILAKL